MPFRSHSPECLDGMNKGMQLRGHFATLQHALPPPDVVVSKGLALKEI
jgi:hypothetical protein